MGSDLGLKGVNQRRQEVTKGELPLSCPREKITLGSAHPKVYLAIEKTGEVTCPYCGTIYTLSDRES